MAGMERPERLYFLAALAMIAMNVALLAAGVPAIYRLPVVVAQALLLVLGVRQMRRNTR
jgi:Flp pilus assembly protein TadB